MTSGIDVPASPFGVRLRQWRKTRNLSQLDLAGRAGSTARHVSFLETGRSRPTREMVLRLAAVLDLSLRERNQLLQIAGFAPAYPQASVDDPDLRPYTAAMNRLLASHEPFPALVLDAYSAVVAANRPAALLFGPNLVGTNMIERYSIDPAVRAGIVNLPEVAGAIRARLHAQLSRAPLDERLRDLVEMAERELPLTEAVDPTEPVACPWFRVEDTVIRTIMLAARFDAPLDVTLDELRIELVYPLDATAEQFFRRYENNSDRTK